jgi:hypothetical protein
LFDETKTEGRKSHDTVPLKRQQVPLTSGLPIIPFAYPTVVLVEKRREEARLANRTSFQGSNSTGEYTPHREEEGGGQTGQPDILPGVNQYR